MNQKHFFIFSAVVLCLMFSTLVVTKPITQDEGVFLTIGKYLNHGLVPYQDFFDHKPPAIYFLFAALFKIFGTNIWGPKVLLIICVGASALVVKKLGEKIRPDSGWLAAVMYLFLMTQFEGYFLLAEPIALLPLLLGCWLVLQENSGRWRLWLAGLLLGTTLLLKQTMLLSVVPLLILAIHLLVKRVTMKKDLGMLFLGFLFPFIVLASYLGWHQLTMEAWRQIVVLTLTSYPREPIPVVLEAIRWNFFWTLPIWILMVLAIRLPMNHKKLVWALILLPLPAMFFRHYPHYWVQILPFVAMFAAAVMVTINRRALSLAIMIFCLGIGGGKVAQDVLPNWTMLGEQLRVARALKAQPADAVLAENQFTGFYFLLPQRPLNKFLYITEITNAVGAEQQTSNDLQKGQTVMILWPVDLKYASAKKLQNFVLDYGTEERIFFGLGMRVVVYRKK